MSDFVHLVTQTDGELFFILRIFFNDEIPRNVRLFVVIFIQKVLTLSSNPQFLKYPQNNLYEILALFLHYSARA